VRTFEARGATSGTLDDLYEKLKPFKDRAAEDIKRD